MVLGWWSFHVIILNRFLVGWGGGMQWEVQSAPHNRQDSFWPKVSKYFDFLPFEIFLYTIPSEQTKHAWGRNEAPNRGQLRLECHSGVFCSWECNYRNSVRKIASFSHIYSFTESTLSSAVWGEPLEWLPSLPSHRVCSVVFHRYSLFYHIYSYVNCIYVYYTVYLVIHMHAELYIKILFCMDNFRDFKGTLGHTLVFTLHTDSAY